MHYNESGRYGRINSGIGPKIVVVGGGTGLSVILRGIKKITQNITAIVTVADDGGGSGILRRELNMLPPGDIRNCISAMSDNEGVMEELLKFRFTEGSLSGQNMGNLIIAALYEIYGDFETAVEKMHDILKIKGRVVPVTNSAVTLCAELENGLIVRGESRIPECVIEQSSAIKSVFLDPADAKAADMAVNALMTADMIVLGPGSLFSSIIPNLLVEGISEAITQSSGIKILICNVMTQRGETDNYTITDYTLAVERYLSENAIKFLVANNKQLNEKAIESYSSRGTHQMLLTDTDRKILTQKGITLIENNFINISEQGLIRHDSDRISSVLFGLINSWY